MSESVQHIVLKQKARDTFLRLGYTLVSFDKEVVAGYRPDIILENNQEVLFVEVVVTSDHELDEVVTEYHGKPVRFVKYNALDFWPKMPLRKKPMTMDKMGRLTIPKRFRDALGLPEGQAYPLWVEAYPDLENYKRLMLRK